MDKAVLGNMGGVYVTYAANVTKYNDMQGHWYDPLTSREEVTFYLIYRRICSIIEFYVTVHFSAVYLRLLPLDALQDASHSAAQGICKRKIIFVSHK